MIYGLTHDDDKNMLGSLTAQHRIGIGLRGEKFPKKLDYFVFKSRDEKGNWVLDEDLGAAVAEYYGVHPSKLCAMQVYLASSEFEKTCFSEYAMVVGKSGAKVCWGNGKIALRREGLTPGGRPYVHEPCGRSCPEMMEGKCKPTVRLFVELVGGPAAGRLCYVQTTSYASLASFVGTIAEVRHATGGMLKGIPLTLSVFPKLTTYAGGSKVTTAYVMSLEFVATDTNRKDAEMKEYAMAYLGSDHAPEAKEFVVHDQTADSVGEDVKAEFYPDDDPDDDVIPAPSAVDPENEPLPEEPPAEPTAPKYTWDDVPAKSKGAVMWYLQKVTGKTGTKAVKDALASAQLSMDKIVAKAEAAMAAEEEK